MKILILGGAGMMGACTVRDLLSERSPGVEDIVVADGFEDRLKALQAAQSSKPSARSRASASRWTGSTWP